MNRARCFLSAIIVLAFCLQFAACGGTSSSGGGGGNGVTTTSLPDGKVGTTYAAMLQASGGTPPYTWTLAQGTLPPGLALGSGGTISGSPTQSGTFGSLVFTAADSAGHSANSSALSITVAPSLQVTTTSLPNAMVGTTYSTALQASGGTAPYTWVLATGILGSIPPGLNLSSSGVISGTPTEPGLFGSLAFTVTDAKGLTANSAALSINVAALPLVITTMGSLPIADVGVPYAQFLAETGGDPPFTWSIKSGGMLPNGLTLNPSSGGIKGTPTTQGISTYVFQVTDSSSPAMTATSGNITLSVQVPLAITTTSLPNGMVGSSYMATLQATGGTEPYTWSFNPSSQGTLPNGLTLNANGTITGTPTQQAAGANNSLIFTVTDSTGAMANSLNLSIFIAPLPLTITTTSLPSGQVGVLYQSGVTSTGGIPPFTWSIKSGNLPAGLTLGTGGGGITGTPQGPTGPSTAVYQVMDSSSPAMIATSVPLTIQILPGPLTVTTESLPNGTVGTPYSATLMATGGVPPYTWSFVPGSLVALPPGLILNTNGTIVGTPAEPITRSGLEFQVTDSTNTTAASEGLTITINPGPLVITTTSLPNGTPGVPYSATLQGSGGEGLYTFTLKSGTLPTGLTLGPGGFITGTPKTAGISGPLVFELNDANNDPPATSQNLTIDIAFQALAVTTRELPLGTVGVPYSTTLQASGGQLPYTWSQTGGTLPAGLTLNPTTGVISGTPTTVGAATGLIFEVTDNTNAHALSGSLTLNIPPVTVISTFLPGGEENGAYSAKVLAAYGKPPYTWSVSPALPATLSLGPATGIISGTYHSVQTLGPYVFQATDATGTTANSPNLTIQFADVACPTGAEAKLGTQPIAFLFRGFDASTNGAVDVAGSFTPNGTGVVLSGEEDINKVSSVNGSVNRVIVSGTYSLGTDPVDGGARGCLTLTDAAAVTTNYRFAMGGFNGTNYTTGRIIESDDSTGTGTRGSGVLRQQTPAAFTTGLSGLYAYLLSGVNAANEPYVVGGSLFTAANANGGAISNVAADADSAGVLSSDLTGGNGYFSTASTVDGRGTTAFAAGTVNAALVYYIVSTNEVILLSSDPISGNPLSSGEAFLTVPGGGFGLGDLSNFFLYHSLGVPGSTGSVATIGTVQFDGAGNISSGAYDQDDAGNSLEGVAISGSYTVDLNTGRVQFTGDFGSGSANSPVGYIIKGGAANSAVLIGTDVPATSGLLEFQSATSVVNLSGLTGAFSLGTDVDPDYDTWNLTGGFSFTTDSGLEDNSYPAASPTGPWPGTFLAPNQMISFTPVFATDGTGTFGPNTKAVTNGIVVYYIPDQAATIIDPTVTAVVK